MRRCEQGRGRRARARLSIGVIAVAGLLAAAAPASADSAVITVTNTAGQPDPAAGVPRVFTLSGTASVPEYVYVRTRAPGGAPCAPTAASDSGATLDDQQGSDFWYGDSVNGSFSLKSVASWDSPGPAVFCIWLASVSGGKYDATITAPFSQTIGFRAPTGTVTGSTSPASPAPGQQATLTVTGASEAPEQVYAKIRQAGGAPCGPTFDSDAGESLISGRSVNGSFSAQATTTQQQPGNYLICLWLAASATDASPVAGPQPLTITVAAPPPHPLPPAPCTVPGLSHNVRLAAIEQRIRSAHCGVGHVGYIHSRRVRRGYVIALSPRPGAHLGHGAAVNVVVSTGPSKQRKRSH